MACSLLVLALRFGGDSGLELSRHGFGLEPLETGLFFMICRVACIQYSNWGLADLLASLDDRGRSSFLDWLMDYFIRISSGYEDFFR